MASLGTHIPKEITEYQEKIIGGLTLRQLVAGAAAVLSGGLTFLFCHLVFGMNAEQSSYFIMAAALPPAVVGFLRPQNMDFERYLVLRYRHWLRSRPIPYQTTTIRGETTHGPVAKAKHSIEYTNPCHRYSRRRERQIIRQTRRSIRRTRKEIRRAQRAFRRKHRI